MWIPRFAVGAAEQAKFLTVAHFAVGCVDRSTTGNDRIRYEKPSFAATTESLCGRVWEPRGIHTPGQLRTVILFSNGAFDGGPILNPPSKVSDRCK